MKLSEHIDPLIREHPARWRTGLYVFHCQARCCECGHVHRAGQVTNTWTLSLDALSAMDVSPRAAVILPICDGCHSPQPYFETPFGYWKGPR